MRPLPGEFFALLGPNGAGKTTTRSPDSGSIILGGRDTVRKGAAVRRSVGIIFQRPSLDLNLAAGENARFHAIL